MRKKMLFVFITALLMLTACSSNDSSSSINNSSNEGNEKKSTEETNEEDLKIGVVLMTLSSEYWKIHMAGAQDAAKELGVEIEILGPAEETLYEQQVKMVEDLISTKVNGLVVAPSLPEAMLPALQKAHNANIPVVLADANVNEFEDRVSFIGTENYEAAFKGGEYISDRLNDGDKVLIVRGQMGAKVHDERTEGFQAALEGKNIEFIVQDAQSDRVKAVNIVENVLTADPDIKAVFATSDEMALGSFKGLENKDSTHIPLIGFDGTPDGLQAVVDGQMVANIAQDPYRMGYLGVESAVKAIKGESVEKRIDSGAEVYTKDNVEQRIHEVEGYLNN
ncbi:sugar ABC transporter substrate-binding protein [Pseudogracilibacillus sp. SO30301A]|uniref:sugar ABC transporter substrate-binding protein n=1 Tax=Pseudogracilibacillus sp. SO30301A TaxID=3098291 RepID=UPI00300E4C54